MTPRWASRWILIAFAGGGVLAGLLALLGAPWPLPLDAALAAHVSGLVAGYLVAVILALMSRTPVLERRVGSDRLVRWHSRAGRVFLLLVLGHAVAAVWAWTASRGEAPWTAFMAVLGLPGLLTATVGTVMFVAVAVISIRRARRRLSYERWHALHLLTYVAVAVSFAHELAGPNLAGHRAAQLIWSLAYAYAFALVLRYRILGPLLNLWRHRLRVETVVPEADGVVSIILHGRRLDELAPEPGQFFRWRFLSATTFHLALPFSLSAPRQGNFLRITVKALGTGSRRVQSIRPGTLVLAEGPSGAMTARRRTRPSVLLVAGGVGITPMRALFETLDVPSGRLTLLYRASRPADIVFRAELEVIARRKRAEIIWLVGPSALPRNQLTVENLRTLVPDVAERDVYLCASPGLSAAFRSVLAQAGVARHQVHDEDFSF